MINFYKRGFEGIRRGIPTIEAQLVGATIGCFMYSLLIPFIYFLQFFFFHVFGIKV